MSNAKKAKRVASTDGGVGVLEQPVETLILTKFTAAAGEMGLTAQMNTPAALGGRDMTASVWNRAQRITGLWSISERGNSWVSIRGVGWKKLSDASDSANQALTVLAAQALQTARNIDYREESDGMIHEIYVW